MTVYRGTPTTIGHIVVLAREACISIPATKRDHLTGVSSGNPCHKPSGQSAPEGVIASVNNTCYTLTYEHRKRSSNDVCDLGKSHRENPAMPSVHRSGFIPTASHLIHGHHGGGGIHRPTSWLACWSLSTFLKECQVAFRFLKWASILYRDIIQRQGSQPCP